LLSVRSLLGAVAVTPPKKKKIGLTPEGSSQYK